MVLQKFQTTHVMQKFHYFAHPVLVAVTERRAEIKKNMVGLSQGWAIISADGPHVGRPSPSRAELLDEQKRAQ